MKTSTENNTTLNSPQDSLTHLPGVIPSKPSRSVRPSKSMVKVNSLRPQRIELTQKLRRKPIKA